MKKICVYTNDFDTTVKYSQKIEKGIRRALGDNPFNIIAMPEMLMRDSVKRLKNRSYRLRRQTYSEHDTNLFDETDILFIDCDYLFNRPEKPLDSLITGESLSYPVRFFTSCKIIILLNTQGSNPFDLSLKNDLTRKHFVDLLLGEDQLDNPNLWKYSQWRGFRPWYWPCLLRLLEDFPKRIEDSLENLDTKFYEVLGLDKQFINSLPRNMITFLSHERHYEEMLDLTLRELAIESFYGLDRGHKKINQSIVLARAATYLLSKWIETFLIPTEELFDAPALFRRYSALIGRDFKEESVRTLQDWNSLISLDPNFDDLPLFTVEMEPARLQKDFWLSKPLWNSNVVSKISDKKRLWDYLDYNTRPVFCYDASKYYRYNSTKQFIATIDGPFCMKFAKVFKGIEYTPLTCFSY